MTLHDFDREEAYKELSTRQLSVDQYFQWIQQQPEAHQDPSELIEGKIRSSPKNPDQMRMLRLLQWQLQHFLKLESGAKSKTLIAEKGHFEVHVRPLVQFSELSYLKPAILVRKGSGEELGAENLSDSNTVWIIDIVEDSIDEARTQLYAQAGISNYWSFESNSIELTLYQQPSASGYQSHRILQIGDRASPNSVPVTVELQEPVPLYFMTRTLSGQQPYRSSTLPFSFSRT